MRLYKLHGIDSTRFPTFGDVTGTKEDHAVRTHPIVFQSILKLLPWEELHRSVKRHQAAAVARTFSYKSHLVAMIYAQLAGASSQRAVVAELASHANRLAQIGVSPPRKSTLTDANRYRPAAVFADLLSALISRAHPALRRSMNGLTYLIDSTSVSLNGLSGSWASFSEKVCGAKLHIVYDPDADCPVYASVSASRVNDITAAKAMPITPGATYVFDLGYYDFAWWAKLDAAGCRIVTRLKKNTPFRPVEERDVPGGAILSDRIGYLPDRLAFSRKQPLDMKLREVRVQLETGAVLRVFTNDLDATAQEIADLYKRRWAIELFFRWVKQTLKIRKFLGTSENAVRIQLLIALIAFLLLRLAQATQIAVQSPLTFARLVASNLMQARGLRQLDRPESSKPARGTMIGQGLLL
jgi:hypothetical protein